MLTGLSPVIDQRTRVLVLGSMPGERSLRQRQYYANPGNRFWRLIGDLFAVDLSAPYSERCVALLDHGVGLWDVLKHCSRVGSLDADIIPTTEEPNDFSKLLRKYANVSRIVLNGAKAAKSFRTHVDRTIPLEVLGRVEILERPSTSGANARLSYVDLLERWEEALITRTA